LTGAGVSEMSAAAELQSRPFLDSQPPPWAARGLAWLLLAMFALLVLAAIVVQVPETVTARFVLVPVHGTDPVRAFKDGIVTEIRTEEARSVRAGEPLFVLSSPPVGDRAAEWQGLRAQLEGADRRSANVRSRFENEKKAREDEVAQAKEHLKSLDRTIAMNTEELAIAGELAQRQKKTFEEGVSSWTDMARLRLEINRLEVEAEAAKSERENTRRSIEKLEHEAHGKQAEFKEVERSFGEDLEKTRIRTEMLAGELAQTGNVLTATAPCTGSVVRLAIRSPRTAVREGDLLAEVVCAGESLQAELTLPQEGLALVRPGQTVKLLYEAFPYQRYGVRSATIRWVSPAGGGGTEGKSEDSSFRALADLKERDVLVSGTRRSVAPGMGGRARVLVGRRSLLSYAFEPLRQLRESLSGAPK
jgi:membrane fusion protein